MDSSVKDEPQYTHRFVSQSNIAEPVRNSHLIISDAAPARDQRVPRSRVELSRELMIDRNNKKCGGRLSNADTRCVRRVVSRGGALFSDQQEISIACHTLPIHLVILGTPPNQGGAPSAAPSGPELR
jgi:hypothetical protein